MGCVSSRRDINDIHPNIFQVMNVDELGQHVSPGQLELTESELVLYQRGKAATRWPLRCLRRYGFDTEIFSFESGRRCPTGPGIYAFRCRRADQLFNLLQQNIQLRNLSDDIVTVANELSIPAVSSGPPVSSRQPNEQGGYLERAMLPRAQHQSQRLSRPGSVTSNGPASPQSASSPTPTPLTFTDNSEHNNNNNNNSSKRPPQQQLHSYTNTEATAAAAVVVPVSLLDGGDVNATQQPYYLNLEPSSSPTLSSGSEPYAQLNMDEECCHVYMNVTPTTTTSLCDEDPRHCYANLDEVAVADMLPLPLPATRTVNYIVLDLEKSRRERPCAEEPQTPITMTEAPLAPESPRRHPAKGYATIDFNRTVALSHSVNPCLELDNEGSRKTRHNSTIGDLAPVPPRHSTSLSD